MAWDTAIKTDASIDGLDISMSERSRKDKWRTEEKAIKHFRSTWSTAIITEQSTPIRARSINQIEEEEKVRSAEEIRRKPNTPNFRITAARIMEPRTGASTWARGNQEWKKNTGNLTKNARRKQAEEKGSRRGRTQDAGWIRRDKHTSKLRTKTRDRKSGREKKRV